MPHLKRNRYSQFEAFGIEGIALPIAGGAAETGRVKPDIFEAIFFDCPLYILKAFLNAEGIIAGTTNDPSLSFFHYSGDSFHGEAGGQSMFMP